MSAGDAGPDAGLPARRHAQGPHRLYVSAAQISQHLLLLLPWHRGRDRPPPRPQSQDPQGAVVAEAASSHEDLGQIQDQLRRV